MTKTQIDLPWSDTSKMEIGKWYPHPVGYFQRDNKGYIVEGYDIFELDPEDDGLGDIIPAGPQLPSLPFSAALAICEAHNGGVLLSEYPEEKTSSK